MFTSRALPQAKIKYGLSVMTSVDISSDVVSVACIAGKFCRSVTPTYVPFRVKSFPVFLRAVL